MNILQTILKSVSADAQDKLVKSLERKNIDATKSAIREIVEAKLPDPRMPSRRISKFYPGRSGVTVAWQWVVAVGTATFLVNVPLSWESIGVEVSLAYPALRTKTTTLFRNSSDPKSFPAVLDQAIRQVISLGFLHP